MTRSFSEARPHGGRLLLVTVLVLAGVATFQAPPAGACSPPENFPPESWPQCTTTTEPPESTTSTVPPSTTSTLPTTTTLDTAVPSSVPSEPPSLPPGSVPPTDPGAPFDELPRTGFDVRSFAVGLVFLILGTGAVVAGKVSERKRLQNDTGLSFRDGRWKA